MKTTRKSGKTYLSLSRSVSTSNPKGLQKKGGQNTQLRGAPDRGEIEKDCTVSYTNVKTALFYQFC